MERMLFPVVALWDADPDDQSLLKQALEQCRPDLRIHLFTRGEALLAFLRQETAAGVPPQGPGLILVNLHLPVEEGFDLVEEIKGDPDLKRIPLIVLIGSCNDQDIRRYYDLGANTVVTRPVLFNELAGVLKTLCEYWFGPVRV